jgi:hypothetical protein
LQVIQLLENTSRDFTSETEKLEGILKWVSHKKKKRAKYVFELARILDFDDIYSQNPAILSNNILEDDPNCSAMLYKLFKVKTLQGIPLSPPPVPATEDSDPDPDQSLDSGPSTHSESESISNPAELNAEATGITSISPVAFKIRLRDCSVRVRRLEESEAFTGR